MENIELKYLFPTQELTRRYYYCLLKLFWEYYHPKARYLYLYDIQRTDQAVYSALAFWQILPG